VSNTNGNSAKINEFMSISMMEKQNKKRYLIPLSPPETVTTTFKGDEDGSEDEIKIIDEKRSRLDIPESNNNDIGYGGPEHYNMPLLIENNVDTKSCKTDEAYDDLDDADKMFDEQDASETLLMLSSARYNQNNNSFIEESEVSSSVNMQDEQATNIPVLCPCEAVARLERVTKEGSEKDHEDLIYFESRLTKLLVQLLGNKKIASLGITNYGPIHVLERVLRLTGTKVIGQDDLCSENCKRFSEQLEEDQLKWRKVKSKLAALELNTEALLKICIPHENVWDSLGWRDKRVIDIISQIVDYGLPVLRL